MNTTTKSAADLSLAESIIALLKHYLGGRKGLILLTVAAVGTGLFLNWGWLVAVGVAPVLLAFAPCAVMCALGLCMNRMCHKPGPVHSRSDHQGNDTFTAAKPEGKTQSEI